MFVKRRIQSYLLELSNYNVPNVDALPQMNFYMDQVISYLEDNLKVFEIDDKLITSSMVNNYVKGKVIPAPAEASVRSLLVGLPSPVLNCTVYLASSGVVNDFSSLYAVP